MLELINVMFPIMFIIVVGIIIFSLVRGIITWNKNNQSPRLTVSVVVAAKRENITHHQHANEMIAILSDREEFIKKKEMEQAQAVINEIYRNGL